MDHICFGSVYDDDKKISSPNSTLLTQRLLPFYFHDYYKFSIRISSFTCIYINYKYIFIVQTKAYKVKAFKNQWPALVLPIICECCFFLSSMHFFWVHFCYNQFANCAMCLCERIAHCVEMHSVKLDSYETIWNLFRPRWNVKWNGARNFRNPFKCQRTTNIHIAGWWLLTPL